MNNGVILFLLLLSTTNKKKGDLLSSVNLNNILDIDSKYTAEKIKLIKKVGPYFPEEYIPSINKAIMLTERIVKIYDVIEFMNIKETQYIKKSIPVENNKARLDYIANTIKKEYSEEEIKNMGPIVEMVLNINKHTKMMNMLSYVMSTPDNLNDPNNMLKLMGTLMQGTDENEGKKMQDMTKMLDILKTLDKPRKPKKENLDNEENKDKDL